MRHPVLAELLDQRAPALVHDVVWADGTLPLRISSYVGAAELPEELVTSVRVIVFVGTQVVLCHNADGFTHAWPGGRRQAGESYLETACREVREETGWVLDPASLEPLGWLHLFCLGDPLPPYPYPDALQLVLWGRATERLADDWTDAEGYELASRLAELQEAYDAVSPGEPMCRPFLRMLIGGRT